jgi:hypothetical protein
VNSPPPPPNLNSPEDNSLAARRMRALSRRGRNQNNPNAPPGGPQ